MKRRVVITTPMPTTQEVGKILGMTKKEVADVVALVHSVMNHSQKSARRTRKVLTAGGK